MHREEVAEVEQIEGELREQHVRVVVVRLRHQVDRSEAEDQTVVDGEDPQRAADVEGAEGDGSGALFLSQEQGDDQEAGEDEEHVHAEEAAPGPRPRDPRVIGVVPDDREDAEAADPVEAAEVARPEERRMRLLVLGLEHRPGRIPGTSSGAQQKLSDWAGRVALNVHRRCHIFAGPPCSAAWPGGCGEVGRAARAKTGTRPHHAGARARRRKRETSPQS